MTVESGRPAPVTTDANSRAHDRDAVSEAWMQEWAPKLIQHWDRQGTFGFGPELDAEVRQHWPELWMLVKQVEKANQRISYLLMNEKLRRNLP